jgi:RNA polymerase sigma-70 factor, ECF subfamily
MSDEKPASLGASNLQRFLRERALRLTGKRGPDCDDLVQDTLERALRNLHRFTSGTNLRAWLATMMQRLMIDQHRRRRLRLATLPELPAPEPDPEREDRENLALDMLARVDELLARLPREFRSVLELHAHAGLGYREIARRLEIPVSTVGTRLMRARRMMRTISGQSAWAEPPRARARRRRRPVFRREAGI